MVGYDEAGGNNDEAKGEIDNAKEEMDEVKGNIDEAKGEVDEVKGNNDETKGKWTKSRGNRRIDKMRQFPSVPCISILRRTTPSPHPKIKKPPSSKDG
ncbi:hypothetical protein BACCIP111883_00390 [Sutcliffiella rhizosphaerae]|uniref:Uncharacterized protein n=1 Tax=Sutcliffiella rhizosphaerae TaxID=2880967 RepID=A0ABM8YIB7_9BACI|nr:hypothetical protein BACCIP111883_00390 [Sutcliffiella rhizosphaerae]